MSLSPRESVIVKNPAFKSENQLSKSDDQSSKRDNAVTSASVSVIQVNNGSRSTDPQLREAIQREHLRTEKTDCLPCITLF